MWDIAIGQPALISLPLAIAATLIQEICMIHILGDGKNVRQMCRQEFCAGDSF
jgi:hypothetical protein